MNSNIVGGGSLCRTYSSSRWRVWFWLLCRLPRFWGSSSFTL